MSSPKNKNFWSIFFSVSIWGVIILLCLVFFRNCSRPHFFAVSIADNDLITELQERKGIVDWSQLQVDSLNIVHLSANIDSVAMEALRENVLREEIKAGRLMTTNQMSENITGYYDKLIDVLIALFIIFTVVSYVTINSKFKEKYEEDKATIMEEIKKSIMESNSLHKDLENTITTRISKNTVTEETIHDIREKLSKNDEYFDLLASVCDDLTEDAAQRTEIVNPNGENKGVE